MHDAVHLFLYQSKFKTVMIEIKLLQTHLFESNLKIDTKHDFINQLVKVTCEKKYYGTTDKLKKEIYDYLRQFSIADFTISPAIYSSLTEEDDQGKYIKEIIIQIIHSVAI